MKRAGVVNLLSKSARTPSVSFAASRAVKIADVRCQPMSNNPTTDCRRSVIVERYPKFPDDRDLPPEMEMVDTDDGFLYRLRDTGLRLEIDGDTYVPDAIAPTDGYIKLEKESPRDEDMVRVSDHDVKLHVDMSSNIVATGGDYDAE